MSFHGARGENQPTFYACCLLQVDLQRARRNFELWYGGVPRLVVELPSTEDDESRDKLLAMDAINTTSIEQV
jgi:hypothetical protein